MWASNRLHYSSPYIQRSKKQQQVSSVELYRCSVKEALRYEHAVLGFDLGTTTDRETKWQTE